VEFELVLRKLLEGFEEHGIRYAAIGGYAMGLLGAERLTQDLDFLVQNEDSEKLYQLMSSLGYKRIFDSKNVSQYQGDIFIVWGYVDFLKAFRPIARKMLEESLKKQILGGEWEIRVVRPEDIIGLKAQAIANNPMRKEKDTADIVALLEIAQIEGNPIDWNRIEDYYKLFNMENEFEVIKERYHA
jgi:uncharacterized protein (DUF1330 family)